MKVEEVAIVGAGPAGLATAIQLRRYGVPLLLFERKKAGGLLHNANLVENYPGFPSGIKGKELVELFIRQVHNLDIDITYEAVRDVSYDDGCFHLRTGQKEYVSRIVVIATGTKPIRFTDLSIPEELANRVFYEVYELLDIIDKCVLIVGSGDAAFDYALNLSRKNQVIILNRGREPKCLPLLWERSLKEPNIRYVDCTQIQKLSKGQEGGILVDCQSTTGEIQYHADYLIGAIGREARQDCMSDTLLKQARELEAKGVLYMIGDVKNGIYRQTSIAVGEGVLAAMKIYRQLMEAGT